MTDEKKRPRGRPKKPAGEKRLSSKGFRPTPELQRRLDEAAEANGRSVSQEIISRLEASFGSDDALEIQFGRKDQRALFRMLAAVSALISERLGKHPLDDWSAFQAMKAAWDKLLMTEIQPELSGEMAKQFDDLREAEAKAPKISSGPRLPKTVRYSGLDMAKIQEAVADLERYEIELEQTQEQNERVFEELKKIGRMRDEFTSKLEALRDLGRSSVDVATGKIADDE